MQIIEKIDKYLTEKVSSGYFKNKYGYDKYTYFAILLWGATMYIDYDNMPSGSGNMKELEEAVNEFLVHLKNNNGDINASEVAEMIEWFCEGAPLTDGSYVLSKKLYDKLMINGQTKLNHELNVIKRSSDKITKIKPNRWMSFTMSDLSKNAWHGDHTLEYTLPKGTKVIFADSIADDYEVIINSNEILKLK